MYPELFNIGPFTVYSYGLMLGTAFIVGSFLLTKEFERKKLNPNFATEITFICIIFGIAGAKLFHIIENLDSFFHAPFEMIFSGGGLTFYGGFILVVVAVFIYLKRKKIPFLYIADAAAPALAIAYGIGRIGCHLAGDGDYGNPTNLPWGTNYENGTVPPSVMFRGSEIAAQYPGGVVPDNTPLHPTPIYEFLVAGLIFFALWKYRKKIVPDGQLFMLYLILSGTARLLVEFIRLNPRIFIGLSEAQLIASGLIIAGIGGLIYFIMNPDIKRFSPLPYKTDKQKKKKE